ncbi:MAG TPA: hypothetical protein VFC62_01345 [Atopostipes sp.]|nr:hypothetical protein [Atopostipes sp.]
MANDKDKKKHDGTENKEQEERLMDEQYEFGLNEDVREELEDKNEDNPKHKESDDKADSDDEVIKD